MSIWNLFKTTSDNNSRSVQNEMHQAIEHLLPDASEDQLVKVACIAGLFARVAYVDFDISIEEREHIKESLRYWTDLDEQTILAISSIALDKIKELAGLENHIYVHHLKPLIDEKTRFSLIEALFELAASDGVVANVESNEISVITTGFDLSQQHYIAARAKVADKIGALKK